VVFVAAIGHLYAANPERGVFRSRRRPHWQKVLYKREHRSVEVVIDPTMRAWCTRIMEYAPPALVQYAPPMPGGGLQIDGRRSTWNQLTAACRRGSDGRHRRGAVQSRRVYAVVDCLVPDPTAPAPPRPRRPPRSTAAPRRRVPL